MNILTTIIGEIFGLFVDDGSLALGILALVGILAFGMALGLPAIAAGPVLFAGCAGLIIENVSRSMRAGK